MYYVNPNMFHPINVRKMYTFPEYKSPAEYTHVCRYANTRLINDPETHTLFHETVSNYAVNSCNRDTNIIVDETTEDRLDIISARVYGTPTYWWIIAMANNILDAFSVPAGTNLRIPYIGDIYSSGNVLGTKEYGR